MSFLVPTSYGSLPVKKKEQKEMIRETSTAMLRCIDYEKQSWYVVLLKCQYIGDCRGTINEPTVIEGVPYEISKT